MPDNRTFDGHSAIFGVNTADDPSFLDASIAAKAVNRVFRGGRNRTRPPFVHNPFLFDDDTQQYEAILKQGNFQGWFQYRKRKPAREDSIIVSVAGRIFALSLVNEKFRIKLVAAGNDAKLLHTWFCQSEEWLYIQNGKDLPLFWNGLVTARRSDPDANEMPVGTIMVAAHGRIFLSNAYDQIAASDIMHGSGQTRAEQNQKFTENEYWAEGGYFGIPVELGPITGMIVVARQDQQNRTQGEVLILSRDGANAIEASQPRSTWKDAQVQTVTLTGRGCEAPGSLINVNNDVFMRSEDGLSSYTMARMDQKRKFAFSKLSRHVNGWMDADTDWLKQFNSTIYFDNRVLSTVSPFVEPPSDSSFGSHRYHRGMVALDLDEASDTPGDSSFNWDGLWTGIRPCALIRFAGRAFAWSYDADGENRIYEIKRVGKHDYIDGIASQKKWFYLSKRFDWKASGSNAFQIKKLVGGEVWVSDVGGIIRIGADYRTDNSPCWKEAMAERDFGSQFSDATFSHPRYGKLPFLSPSDECQKGEPFPSAHGAQHQVMVYGEGDVQIDRVRIAMIPDPESQQGSCEPNNPSIALGEGCKLENDYEYDLASR